MLVHEDWLLTVQRAAVHLPTATAVIADLHLGYDDVRRRHGEAIPAFNLEETLAALRSLHAEHGVKRLVVAGDLCEDGRSPGPVAELFAILLDWGIETIGVIPGNHDRKLASIPNSVPIVGDGLRLGRWKVVHGDAPARGWIVQGHCHSCLRWAGAVAPCFLVSTRRLILPAFSGDAAGVNVLRQRGWQAYRCHAIVGNRVLDFGPVRRIKHATSKPHRE